MHRLRAPSAAALGVIAAIGLGLFATPASAQSGAPSLPAGYVVVPAYTAPAPTMPPAAPRTSSIRGLWIPGLIGLPVAYVATWVHASLSLGAGSEGVNAAFIPVIGPWWVLATQSADVGYYVTAGLVQDISLLCLVLGLAIRIPEPRARIALGDSLPTLELAATPTATGGAMSATVQF